MKISNLPHTFKNFIGRYDRVAVVRLIIVLGTLITMFVVTGWMRNEASYIVQEFIASNQDTSGDLVLRFLERSDSVLYKKIWTYNSMILISGLLLAWSIVGLKKNQ